MNSNTASMVLNLGCLCIVVGLAAFALAEPPRVVKVSPDNGQSDVDPATREIRIVFDQPMDRRGGYSLVGGGPTYPKVIGKPRWADDRTFVVTVKLDPEHDYWLSINSDRFANFRSVKGEASAAYPISFKTRKGPAAAAKLTPEENLRSIEQLRRAIDEDYSYRDLRSLDWDKLFKEAAPKLESSQTARAFALVAGRMLATAEDLHVWLQVGEEVIPSFARQVSPNVNRVSLSEAVPGWRRRSAAVYSGLFVEDRIGYLMIANWDVRQAKDVEAAYEVLRELAGTKALIIDVRPNAGGDEPLAQQFAGCFVDQPVVYAKNVIRRNGQFSQVFDRAIPPNKERPGYRGKVVVLMGICNVSSCESFLLMMKQVPGCKLIGQRSYGSSGNPRPVNLENGVTVFLPSWKDLRPDGTCFEREGIAPDIEVSAKPSDFLTADPVLQAALKTLRE